MTRFTAFDFYLGIREDDERTADGGVKARAGDPVRWTSSQTAMRGVIVQVVRQERHGTAVFLVRCGNRTVRLEVPEGAGEVEVLPPLVLEPEVLVGEDSRAMLSGRLPARFNLRQMRDKQPLER